MANSTLSGVGKGATGLAKEFKDFILRGNVVDLAVGIVIGAAFSGVVQSLVKDLITPLIPAGNTGLSNFSVPSIIGGKLLVGDFINAIISFLIVALVIFFFVVKPVNALLALAKPKAQPAEPAAPTTRDCPYCLSSIPIKATRCAFCTAEVPSVDATAATA